MIFIDQLTVLKSQYEAAFDKLFEDALQHQAHKGDLLLWHVNGFFNYETEAANKAGRTTRKWNPYCIGDGIDGLSERTHYEFIDIYRHSFLNQQTLEAFIFDWKEQTEHVIHGGDKTVLTDMEKKEAISIQLEMMIYLKFWESDMIIRKLYQLTRLLAGQPYDWRFLIPKYPNQQNTSGTRASIIKGNLIKFFEQYQPAIGSMLSKCYNNQIRNAIAHSNYYMISRYIHLTNYFEGKKDASLNVLSFDNWIERFHLLITLHNEYIRLNNRVSEYYHNLQVKNGQPIYIYLEEDGKRLIPLERRDHYNDWVILRNK